MSVAAKKALATLVQVVAGVAVLLACAAIVHPGKSPSWERETFYVINGFPELLYWPAWIVMQLGNLLVIPAAALVAGVLRKWQLAVAILLAGVAKWQLALVVKDQWTRERPASVIEDVVRRGDASAAGEAFVSGHAIIAFALATLLTPYLSRRWRFVAWGLAAGVCLGRIYVGAHLPLDAVGGAAVGWAAGSLLDWLLGPWRRTRGEEPVRA